MESFFLVSTFTRLPKKNFNIIYGHTCIAIYYTHKSQQLISKSQKNKPYNNKKMKIAAIFLVSCVLFSLLPSLTVAEKRPWCPTRKQVFDGSCKRTDYTQCFNDLRNTWDNIGDLGPTDCTCTSQPQNKRLCFCRYLPCPN